MGAIIMRRMYTNLVKLVLLFGLFQLNINAQEIEWKKLQSLPKGICGGEAVTLFGKIYVIAGRDDVSMTTDFLMYDTEIDQWTNLTDVPEKRMNLALATIDNKIYAIGGDRFSASSYEYSLESNKWIKLNDMPTARQHIDCGVYMNDIYVIGGLTSWDSISKKNEVYNVKEKTWKEKSPIPSLRNNPAVVSIDSLIYVIGGGGTEEDVWKENALVECYNVNLDLWEKKSDLPNVLFKPGALVLNKYIYVLGGSSENENGYIVKNDVLVYDTEKDFWSITTPLPNKNIFAAYAGIKNKIYVIGGTSGAPDWESYTDVYEGTVKE